MRYCVVVLVTGVICCAAGLAWSEVKNSTPQGFVSEHKIQLATDPERAYTALVRSVHLWWDAAHTFGGQAGALRIADRAGGCFCEQLASGGSVEHMRVVYAQPGRQLVMRGGLGPLQALGVTGAMTFSFIANSKGTELVYRYVVGGYAPDGLDKLAGPVDQVQLAQLKRLQAFVANAP